MTLWKCNNDLEFYEITHYQQALSVNSAAINKSYNFEVLPSRVANYITTLSQSVTIIKFSFNLWSDLEKESGTTLLVTTGLINFGKCDVGSGECEDEYLLKHMDILSNAGKPFEWLKPKDIKRLTNPLVLSQFWVCI